MRNIRFRAWDEEFEEWFYSDKPDDIHFFEFVDGTLRGFAIRPPRASDDPMEPSEPYCDDYDPFEFTGLKDKNGVEIYEGDMLDGGTYVDGETKPPSIVQYIVTPYISGFDFGQAPASHFAQVIGNIHEDHHE